MRISILGNSGSGKSTLAHRIAKRFGTPVLDLDTVAWVPGQIAVARPAEAAIGDVRRFCSTHADWVVEGCYASLIAGTFAFGAKLLFLNPGIEQCLANCRTRPWEPHKYTSQAEQNDRLESLLSWVRDYDIRRDDMSLAAHQACFDACAGDKYELTAQVDLSAVMADEFDWLS
jgi:adenylate kinase family enzyme